MRIQGDVPRERILPSGRGASRPRQHSIFRRFHQRLQRTNHRILHWSRCPGAFCIPRTFRHRPVGRGDPNVTAGGRRRSRRGRDLTARRSVHDTLPLDRRHFPIFIFTTLEAAGEFGFLIVSVIFPLLHARTVSIRSLERRPSIRLLQHAFRLSFLVLGRIAAALIATGSTLSGSLAIAELPVVHSLQRRWRRAGASSARVAARVRGEPLMSRIALR